MNRRRFLKGFGQIAAMVGVASVVPASILPVANALAASQGATRPGSDPNAYTQVHRISVKTIDTAPLTEGLSPEALNVTFYQDYPAYQPISLTLDPRITDVRWFINPTQTPSMYDPLGQWGFVGLKYTYNGQQYGDWIRISEEIVGAIFEDIAKEAQAALVQVTNMKIQRIDAKKFALSKLQRVTPQDVMKVGHINQFVDYLQAVA